MITTYFQINYFKKLIIPLSIKLTKMQLANISAKNTKNCQV